MIAGVLAGCLRGSELWPTSPPPEPASDTASGAEPTGDTAAVTDTSLPLPPVNAMSLEKEAAVKWEGQADHTKLGDAIAVLDDLDGDNVPDLAFSAPGGSDPETSVESKRFQVFVVSSAAVGEVRLAEGGWLVHFSGSGPGLAQGTSLAVVVDPAGLGDPRLVVGVPKWVDAAELQMGAVHLVDRVASGEPDRDLDTDADVVTWEGYGDGGEFGARVAVAAGEDPFLVAAAPGPNGTGSIYLLYDPYTATTADLPDAVKIRGESGALVGRGLDVVLGADGLPRVVATEYDYGDEVGRATLLAPRRGGPYDLDDLAEVTVVGDPSTRVGASARAVGDLDGDGTEDWAVLTLSETEGRSEWLIAGVGDNLRSLNDFQRGVSMPAFLGIGRNDPLPPPVCGDLSHRVTDEGVATLWVAECSVGGFGGTVYQLDGAALDGRYEVSDPGLVERGIEGKQEFYLAWFGADNGTGCQLEVVDGSNATPEPKGDRLIVGAWGADVTQTIFDRGAVYGLPIP